MILFPQDLTLYFHLIDLGKFNSFLNLCIFLLQVFVLLLRLPYYFSEVAYTGVLAVIGRFAAWPLVHFESALALVAGLGRRVDHLG